MTDQTALKPLIWVGSSREDLRAFPDPVQDHMGYALYMAQRGGKHRDTKTLKGFAGAGVVEVIKNFRGGTFRAVYTLRGPSMSSTPSRKSRSVDARRLVRTSSWSNNACVRLNRLSSGGTMGRKRFEIGSQNVFRDLGVPDAEEHLVKAQLVFKIDTIMKRRRLKQSEAATLLGVKQPDVSRMLRGDFRPFSVERLLRFLVSLDQDVEIVVKPHRGGNRGAALHVA